MSKLWKMAAVRRMCRCNRANAAAEFALVLPLFLLLVFGTVDFGCVLYSQSVMLNAARETARRMSVDTTFTDAQATTYAQSYMSGWGPVVASTVTPSHPTCGAFTCAQVSISLPMANAAVLGDPFGFFSGNLVAHVALRQET